MTFANIEYLFLLLLLIPYILWYILSKGKTSPTLQVSDTHMYALHRSCCVYFHLRC